MVISLEKINTRDDPYQLFLDSIRNEATKRNYRKRLDHFLREIPDQIYHDNLGKFPKHQETKTIASFFVELSRKDTDLASDIIAAYIKEHKKRVEKGEISSQTLPNYIKPIKVLLDANRIPIHWKSLHKLLPRRESKTKDRALVKSTNLMLLNLFKNILDHILKQDVLVLIRF